MTSYWCALIIDTKNSNAPRFYSYYKNDFLLTRDSSSVESILSLYHLIVDCSGPMKGIKLIFTAHGGAPCAELSGVASRRFRKGPSPLWKSGWTVSDCF